MSGGYNGMNAITANQYKMLAIQQKRLKNNSVIVGGPMDGPQGQMGNNQPNRGMAPGVTNIRDSMQSKNSNNYEHARANSSLGLYQNSNVDPNNPQSVQAMAQRQYDDIQQQVQNHRIKRQVGGQKGRNSQISNTQ